MVTDSSSPAPPPAVAIRELTRTFGDFTAIDRATADIAVGEVFGVIGPNGAGKSTLIKMLTTLLPPSSGTAVVAGHDIVRAPSEVRRHIGYVPHQGRETPSLGEQERRRREAGYQLPLGLSPGEPVDFLSAGAYTESYASVEFNGFAPIRTYCI